MLEKLADSDERQFKALTGVSRKIFGKLLVAFSLCYELYQQEQYEKNKSNRKRKPGGGRKATLQLNEDRLLFIVVYLKTYPLQEIMGELFGMEVSKVNEWIHRLLPQVRDALDELGVMPERDAQAFAKAQAGRTVILDGTERRRQRPKNPEKQALHYSGKKKTHTDKNLVIAERKTKRVNYLSPTYAGTVHDKKMADRENIVYAKDTILYQDTGFQGYQPNVACLRQPKKSRAVEN